MINNAWQVVLLEEIVVEEKSFRIKFKFKIFRRVCVSVRIHAVFSGRTPA